MLTEQYRYKIRQPTGRDPSILSHYVALLFVGLRSCHSGCAQQALPECSAHQYYSFRPYSGYHLSGLFPDGNTCWLLYQPVWLSPWRGLLVRSLFGIGASAFYPGCCGGQFLSIPALSFHYRVRFGVPGNSRHLMLPNWVPKETATSRLNLSQSFNGLGGNFATLCIRAVPLQPDRRGRQCGGALYHSGYSGAGDSSGFLTCRFTGNQTCGNSRR